MWGQIVLEHVSSLYIVIKYACYKTWSFKKLSDSFLELLISKFIFDRNDIINVVVHSGNLSIRKAEVGRLPWVQGQCRVPGEFWASLGFRVRPCPHSMLSLFGKKIFVHIFMSIGLHRTCDLTHFKVTGSGWVMRAWQVSKALRLHFQMYKPGCTKWNTLSNIIAATE